MNPLRQKAIEHVEAAVKNLRRGLALWPDTDNIYMVQGKAQQEETLAMWEVILMLVTFPNEATIEHIHESMIAAQGHVTTLDILNASLTERLDLALAKIEEMKEEIHAAEEHFKQMTERYATGDLHDEGHGAEKKE